MLFFFSWDKQCPSHGWKKKQKQEFQNCAFRLRSWSPPARGIRDWFLMDLKVFAPETYFLLPFHEWLHVFIFGRNPSILYATAEAFHNTLLHELGLNFPKNLVRVESQGMSPGGCDQVIFAILIHSAVWGKRLEQYAYIIKRRNRLFTVGVETWFQLWPVTSAHHPVLKWMSVSKWAERKVQAARKLSPKAAAQNTRLEYE